MLDNNKLKGYLKSFQITFKAFAENIGMSEAGLYRAIKNNSLKLRDLEKIAEYLGVSIGELLEEGPAEYKNDIRTQKANESEENYRKKNELEILRLKLESCKKEIALKDEIIALLKSEKKHS